MKVDKKSIKPLEELLDSVRDIDGFPIAEDEDILALSDPPFYTACPNPYMEEFIEEFGTPYDAEDDDYNKEPFLSKVSEGKGDSIYKAHPYHTKVPHKAIIQFIEHYTKPGDIVFDGFCGSGMTGVASRILGRYAILSDLSPIATFISHNYNHPVNPRSFENEANQLLKEINHEYGWMYETIHTSNSINVKTGEKAQIFDISSEIKGKVNYFVWSDVFICPYCENEYVFYNEAFDKGNKRVKKKFNCPDCHSELTKNSSKRSFTVYNSTDEKFEIAKEALVLINYSVGKNTYEKIPDDLDFKLIEKINHMEVPYWFPPNKIPEGHNTSQPKRSHGFKYLKNFYSKRNLILLSKLFDLLYNKNSNNKNYLIYTFEQAVMGMANICRYVPTHFSQVNQYLSGTLYVGSLRVETSLDYVIRNKIKRLTNVLKKLNADYSLNTLISTQSIVSQKQIPNNSIDYIFTDPPFGSNLMYSEISILWESWLKILTDNITEAIVNNSQNKDLNDYTDLMSKGFKEMYRILKPNRWITIEFHNTQASVWNSIQEAIIRAGFIVAQVSVLDKKQGSFKQITSAGAVKNDLIINAYKPNQEFSHRFLKNAGEGMEIDFVKEQLEHLPIKPNIGRTEQMIYSKTLAHYVENGFKIKYNSTNFYKLLLDNFTELDGYWFLDNQVKEYNQWKSGLTLDQIAKVLDGQQVLFVSDEKTALTWIYNFLNKPKEYSDIFNAYQEVATKTTDEIPEIRDLLNNNFIFEDGKYRRPLSKQERKELNKNREKELDRGFNKLLEQAKTQKGKIKEVRREALVYGFTKCYQEGRFQDILSIADKLYASTLESSGDIMDFVDIARIKTSGKEEL